MSNRFACLTVACFPAAAVLRSHPDLRGRPVAVAAGRSPALIVVDANDQARDAGVRPGMTVADATGRIADVIVRPRSPADERSASGALLDLALAVSPRVEDGGPGVVSLDLSGCAKLYRREGRLAEDLAARAEEAGLPSHVAIASTRTAARLAAVHAARIGHSAPVLIAPTQEAAALAPLPLAWLDLPVEPAAVLSRWGLRTLGDLAALPPADLIDRLGPEGRQWQRVARGEDVDPFIPYRPPSSCEETVDLEWPIEQVEALAFVLSDMLDRLMIRLAWRGWALGGVSLGLGLAGGVVADYPLTLAAPLTEGRAVLPLLLHGVRAAPPQSAVERITIRAQPAETRAVQGGLFTSSRISPERLAATLARVEALVGREQFGSPVLVDNHRPDAIAMTPLTLPSPILPSPSTGEGQGGGGPCALRRRRPPIEIDVETRDGLPVRVMSGPWTGVIRTAAGPWRASGQWWTDTAWACEEWDVELTNGRLLRLSYAPALRTWRLDGVYD